MYPLLTATESIKVFNVLLPNSSLTPKEKYLTELPRAVLVNPVLSNIATPLT